MMNDERGAEEGDETDAGTRDAETFNRTDDDLKKELATMDRILAM